MCEANGFDPGKETHLRDQMVELIKIVEGFYACGVAASTYARADAYSGSFMPEPVYSNIGKLLLANQIYDMQRIAHYVSGASSSPCPGRTRITTRSPPPGWPTCCGRRPMCPTTSASRRRVSWRT
jgi:4-hydroxybutyryl-CoA dehydratase/vinylacetyl-CoA-Delta-isomerase